MDCYGLYCLTVSAQRSVSSSARRNTLSLLSLFAYWPMDGCSDRRSGWIRSGGCRRSSPRSRGKAPPPPPPARLCGLGVHQPIARRNNNRRRRCRRANRIVFTFNSSATSQWSFVITPLDAGEVIMSLSLLEIKGSSRTKVARRRLLSLFSPMGGVIV